MRGSLILAALIIGGCGGENAAAPQAASTETSSSYSAEIRRTAMGVPHVKADEYGSLGYGAGYARAVDGVCELSAELTIARGTSAAAFGGASFNQYGGGNLASDFVYRLLIDEDALTTAYDRQTTDTKAFLKGYAAGYNRYLRDTPAEERPEPCRGAGWVTEITPEDALRGFWHISNFSDLRGLVAAVHSEHNKHADLEISVPRLRVGSNGVAIGRDITGGGGALLANPHWFLTGGLAFYPVHMTIPGELDAMGGAIGLIPPVGMGFNEKVAWAATYDAAVHSVYYKLAVADDGQTYAFDGENRAFTYETVEVENLEVDGSRTTKEHRFRLSHLGPVTESPDGDFFALLLANQETYSGYDMFFGLKKAKSVDEMIAAGHTFGPGAFFNYMIADDTGDVAYMNSGSVPNLAEQQLGACVLLTPDSPESGGRLILDGARSACAPSDNGQPFRSSIVPADRLPLIRRTDYVHNSNDSHWLNGGGVLSEPFSPLFGLRGPQGWRTRYGIDRLNAMRETGGDAASLRAMLLSNTAHSAEVILDDALLVCDGVEEELQGACDVLRAWDRTYDADQRGGELYRKFAANLFSRDVAFKIPFDPERPQTTPSGLATDTDDQKALIRSALKDAADETIAQFGRIDPLWTDVMRLPRGDSSLPLHGGPSWPSGVYNVSEGVFNPDAGHYVPTFNSSFIVTAEFKETGVEAYGLHVGSQSKDPASPHHMDWTQRYFEKDWVKLPFREADIAAETVTTMTITE